MSDEIESEFRALFARLEERCSRRVHESEPALRVAISNADWLKRLAALNERDMEDMPAPELPMRYRRQLEVLVSCWSEERSPEVFGSIQRLLYEFYGLSTHEIAVIAASRG